MQIPVTILAIFLVFSVICLVISVFYDAKRDARIPAKDDWPANGFRLMRRGYKVKKASFPLDSAKLETVGYKLFYTLDRTHIHKWLSVYPVWISLYAVIVGMVFCFSIPLACGMGVGLPVLCYALWQWVEKPWEVREKEKK